jgi:hypothetical protein
MVTEAFDPAGGFTSTRILPAWRLTLRVSELEEALISVRVRRVRGRTAIRALPASSRAMLLKPVEITVSAITCAPAVAGVYSEAPAGFNSTVPLSSFITAFCAKAQKVIPASKIDINVLFILSP